MSCKEQSTLYTEDWVLYPRADASKMRYRPTQHQLDRLDRYINSTLWGLELDSAGVPVSLQARDEDDVWPTKRGLDGCACSL